MVSAVVDFPEVRFAVIEGLRTETGHEHIVIAYPNEKSLRDLFAAPSIVAFGFATRDEAIVAGTASFPTTVADQQTSKTIAGAETNRPQHELDSAQPRGQTGSALRRLGRFLATFCSDFSNLAIVLYSSSNTVSTAIRMALGSTL